MAAIRKELKPQSFATGKTMTIRNTTEHHPEGVGINVIGVIPGTDPTLKDEVIMLGGPSRPSRAAVGAHARGQRQRHGRGRRGWASPRPWPSARSSPSGRSCSSSSAARSRARTRGPRARIITPSTPSIRSTRPPSSSTWKGRARATGSALRAGRPIRRSGRSSRRPTRPTSTGSLTDGSGVLPGPAAAGFGLVLLEGRARR